MRKRYRVLMLAVLAAAIAVPLGFALSLEPKSPAIVSPAPSSDIGDIVAASKATPHVALVSTTVQTAAPGRQPGPALPDGAKLLFVGSALFGLAGVMRRTN